MPGGYAGHISRHIFVLLMARWVNPGSSCCEEYRFVFCYGSNTCGSATKQYQVKDGICETFFPNAFTPNNDRKNDVFKMLSDLKFQEFQLSIYNRWGQQIFAAKNPLSGWDGNFNNKEQAPGTYIWHCVFKRSNVVTQLKGTVILIR